MATLAVALRSFPNANNYIIVERIALAPGSQIGDLSLGPITASSAQSPSSKVPMSVFIADTAEQTLHAETIG